ncbi:MAG: PLDc_N domain-containing protein, partial [Clostridia bacterium]|nr:PLDc_N domain-containing protein [Clostridia bacterium]
MFSQAVFIAVALLLQIGFFLSAGSRIMSDESFRTINLALRALSVILMIYIINRPGNPEFKLTWIVQIAVFPIYGSLFYLYIQGQKLPLLVN